MTGRGRDVTRVLADGTEVVVGYIATDTDEVSVDTIMGMVIEDEQTKADLQAGIIESLSIADDNNRPAQLVSPAPTPDPDQALTITAHVRDLLPKTARLLDDLMGVTAPEPPTDPRERALWLRQHRNTGPRDRR